MPTRPFDDIQPRGSFSAAEFNRMQQLAYSSSNLLGGRGIRVRVNTGGAQFDIDIPQRFPAQITSGPTNGQYAFQEVYWDNTQAAYVVAQDGINDFNLALPAYEDNSQTVPAGKIVELRLSPDQTSYNFNYGSSSAVGIAGLITAAGQVTIPRNTVVYIVPAGGGVGRGYFDNFQSFKIPSTQPHAGIYRVEASAWFLAPTQTAADYAIRFFLNNDMMLPSRFGFVGSCDGNATYVFYNENQFLNPGDKVTPGVFHNQGGTAPKASLVSATIEYLGT